MHEGQLVSPTLCTVIFSLTAKLASPVAFQLGVKQKLVDFVIQVGVIIGRQVVRHKVLIR